jgi:hypothetical protein
MIGIPDVPIRMSRQPKTRLNRSKLILIVTAVVILLVVGILSGVLPFALNTLSCGRLPVIASTFAAAYSYKVPADPGYGPGPFYTVFFCSKEEAERTGFHHDTFPF